MTGSPVLSGATTIRLVLAEVWYGSSPVRPEGGASFGALPQAVSAVVPSVKSRLPPWATNDSGRAARRPGALPGSGPGGRGRARSRRTRTTWRRGRRCRGSHRWWCSTVASSLAAAFPEPCRAGRCSCRSMAWRSTARCPSRRCGPRRSARDVPTGQSASVPGPVRKTLRLHRRNYEQRAATESQRTRATAQEVP